MRSPTRAGRTGTNTSRKLLNSHFSAAPAPAPTPQHNPQPRFASGMELTHSVPHPLEQAVAQIETRHHPETTNDRDDDSAQHLSSVAGERVPGRLRCLRLVVVCADCAFHPLLLSVGNVLSARWLLFEACLPFTFFDVSCAFFSFLLSRRLQNVGSQCFPPFFSCSSCARVTLCPLLFARTGSHCCSQVLVYKD
jgi:hypothetical protein